MAISIPAVGAARVRGHEVRSTANLRECAIAVTMHADAGQDQPPALLEPVYTPDMWAFQHTTGERGCRVKGHWFDNQYIWQYSMAEALPPEVLTDPRQPRENLRPDPARCEPVQSDYALTATLYATADYFDRVTQRGPQQWLVQRLGDVRFPSGKVLMFQTWLWGPDAMIPGIHSVGSVPAPRAALLWGDHSAETGRPGALAPGVPNRWRVMPSPPPPWGQGRPIDDTQDGIFGIDRPAGK